MGHGLMEGSWLDDVVDGDWGNLTKPAVIGHHKEGS